MQGSGQTLVSRQARAVVVTLTLHAPADRALLHVVQQSTLDANSIALAASRGVPSQFLFRVVR